MMGKRKWRGGAVIGNDLLDLEKQKRRREGSEMGRFKS
jgi:hypothetical protein